MKSVEKFTVEIRSGFDQWWRYNAALMCGAFDASGNRIGFASAESRVAEMGSNLEAPPGWTCIAVLRSKPFRASVSCSIFM
jgi:hypothetical protein